MKSIKIILLSTTLITVGALVSCNKGDGVGSLLFSVQDDKELGQQVSDEIESDPTTYPILSETEYSEAYSYLNAMKESILNSSKINYRDEFVWKLNIIDDDVLNAFATPGGHIYVYTGLIKYLDKADDLAGVLGHEIAHADRRHSIKQLEKKYTISFLLSLLLGENSSQISQIAGEIAGTGAVLAFSRSDEAEADEYSVIYLSETGYACNGAATFFQKLIDEGSTGGTPVFLSTHPSPNSRVGDINTKATSIGCDTDPINEVGMTYSQFKALFGLTSLQEQATKLVGNWTLSSALLGTTPRDEWLDAGFSITFNGTEEGGSITSSNVPDISGASDVWPTTSTWSFGSSASQINRLVDDTILTVTFSETTLIIKFDITGSGSRTDGFDGSWTFEFSQPA